jgi:hypothetical protein
MRLQAWTGLIAATALATTPAALGQTSAFTYQGQLRDGGLPVNGAVDLEFTLWDSLANGNLVAGPLAFPGVAVTDGLFTIQLDFGPVFAGQQLWLEVHVNSTPLAPRQELTATPYALYAARLALPFDGTVADGGPAFSVTNTGGGWNAWGVTGVHGASGNRGILGHPNVGVYGDNAATGNYGGFGYTSYGAYGVFGTNGNQGYLGGSNYGVYASADIYGVYGRSSNQFVPSCGVYGENTYWGNYGRLGTTGEGVYGWGANNSVGVQGETGDGTGVDGTGYNGVWGTSYSLDGNGVRGVAHNGSNAYAVWGYSTSGWAGTFSGKAQVTGNFYAGAKFFRVDHPVEPESKYLIHACVESDEMKNVYDGVTTLGANGEAWVELPTWFESLNTDFRYQLTCIGEPALVYVKRKVSGNRFLIAGGTPGLEVSWQVTGVRRDAYARANPMQVEVDKVGAEQGQYLHPEAYGLPETRAIDYGKKHAGGPVSAAK